MKLNELFLIVPSNVHMFSKRAENISVCTSAENLTDLKSYPPLITEPFCQVQLLPRNTSSPTLHFPGMYDEK